jgi:hypothetical protein
VYLFASSLIDSGHLPPAFVIPFISVSVCLFRMVHFLIRCSVLWERIWQGHVGSSVSSHLRLGLPSGLFPSDFSTKTLYKPLLPIRATCSAHLTFLSPEQVLYNLLVENEKLSPTNCCLYFTSNLLRDFRDRSKVYSV